MITGVISLNFSDYLCDIYLISGFLTLSTVDISD